MDSTAGVGAALSPTYSHTNIMKGTIQASIVGGTLSQVTGGKFANGALSAAFAFAFKDAVHAAITIKNWHDQVSAFEEVDSSGLPSGYPNNGHAWIRVSDAWSGESHTWSLFNTGYGDNEDPTHKTDVQEDTEIGRAYKPFVSLTYVLSSNQLGQLNSYIGTPDKWGMFHTCANWVQGAVKVSTGVTLPVRDWGVFGSGTPRQLSDTLLYLNGYGGR